MERYYGVEVASDWRVRDVMVGVLRGARQLEANLEHRFYHMPASMLSAKPEEVRCVALYQSRRLFGRQDAGIRRYGAVSRFQLLPRGEIGELPTRNPDERYYRFEVEEWRELDRTIRAGGVAPGVSMFTTRFLLQNSRFVSELYIRDAEQMALYTRLRMAAARTQRNGGSELLPSRDGSAVMVAAHTVGIYTGDGRYEQHDLREFFHEPYSFLQNIGRYVQITD